LKFANRAKSIKNDARVNEDVNQNALLRKYQTEISQLRSQLEKGGGNNIQINEVLVKLENEKKQAQEDRNQALRMLEERSKDMEK